MHPRIKREIKTVRQMIRLYCRKHHFAGDLCPQCLELANYAHERLAKCPFQGDKATCARCTVHCYSPARREQIRAIMRYSGPRMLFYHPIAAIQHILDGRRQAPARAPHKKSE